MNDTERDTRPPIWTGSFILAVISTTSLFFGLYFLLLALPPYAGKLGASTAQVGLVISVYSIAAMVARTIFGGLIDTQGRKGFLLAGLVIFVAAAASYTLTDNFPSLLLVRTIHGIGWGLATTAVSALVADLAPRARRGEAIGWWGNAPTIAMAIGPVSGGAILDSFGFGAVFLSTAAFGLLAALLVLPIGEPSRPSLPERATARLRPPAGALLPSSVLLLSSLAYGALVAFLPLRLAGSSGRAGFYFTVYALTILVARPAAGRISDRRGRAAVIVPGLALGAAGIALLALADNTMALVASAVLFGAGVGGGSFPGLMSLCVDRSPESMRGAALGTFFTAYDIAIASGAALLGPIYEKFGFGTMALVASIGILLGLALFVIVRRAESRRRP